MAKARCKLAPRSKPAFDWTVKAMPKSSSAVASLNRLSPFSTVSVLRGMETAVSTADAAAASGGATIAPRTIAAAIGKPANAQPAEATAAAVASTAKIASAIKGARIAVPRPVENRRRYQTARAR